jgi:hypothetical protein
MTATLTITEITASFDGQQGFNSNLMKVPIAVTAAAGMRLGARLVCQARPGRMNRAGRATIDCDQFICLRPNGTHPRLHAAAARIRHAQCVCRSNHPITRSAEAMMTIGRRDTDC